MSPSCSVNSSASSRPRLSLYDLSRSYYGAGTRDQPKTSPARTFWVLAPTLAGGQERAIRLQRLSGQWGINCLGQECTGHVCLVSVNDKDDDKNSYRGSLVVPSNTFGYRTAAYESSCGSGWSATSVVQVPALGRQAVEPGPQKAGPSRALQTAQTASGLGSSS